MRPRTMVSTVLIGNGLAVATFVGALLSAAIVSPDDAWAKHKKSKIHAAANSDPCAEPIAFVRNQISKMRSLKAEATQSKSTVFSIFATPTVDPESYSKIAELRRDAEAVNAMLRSGNCAAIDIDQELRSTAPIAKPPPDIHHHTR